MKNLYKFDNIFTNNDQGRIQEGKESNLNIDQVQASNNNFQ